MPFTPSHAAAVLPFLRFPALPASALVVGSISPDIPYYLWLPFGEMSTHSVGAALGVDVLLAALVWLLWHALVAGPALAGMPHEVRTRLASVPIGLRPRLRDAGDVMTLYVAFAIGALTHVVWDSFTHPHRWGTNHIAALNEVYLERPLSHWLQLASSAAGLLALGLYASVWWRTSPRTATDLSPISLGAVASWFLIAMAGGVGAVLGALEFFSDDTGHGLAYVLITSTVSAATVAAMAVCSIWHLNPRLRGRPKSEVRRHA